LNGYWRRVNPRSDRFLFVVRMLFGKNLARRLE
jgi:hypothetical protein